MKRLLSTLFCVLVVLVACAHTPKRFEGPLPDKALRITVTPPQYKEWWHEVEACAGRSKPFQSVRWYVVASGPDGFPWRNPYRNNAVVWVAGLAYSMSDQIVMASGWLFSAGDVKHEMLHLIASPASHDPRFYQGSCAGVVSCVGACLTDPEAP